MFNRPFTASWYFVSRSKLTTGGHSGAPLDRCGEWQLDGFVLACGAQLYLLGYDAHTNVEALSFVIALLPLHLAEAAALI